MARMTVETLHPDIVKSEALSQRKSLEVIDPSPGIFGNTPIEGLVTVIYECECRYNMHLGIPHTHAALYGPRILQFANDCKVCLKDKWSNHGGHEYTPIGVESTDPDHYELYAD